MDDVITLAHTALTHLEEVNTYENALFWLQLNIVPLKHVSKLTDLVLGMSTRIFNFFTTPSESSSSLITQEHHKPACLFPSCILCSLMTVLLSTAPTLSLSLQMIWPSWGLSQTMRRSTERKALNIWCQDNLSLNISKTKEVIVDYRNQHRKEH